MGDKQINSHKSFIIDVLRPYKGWLCTFIVISLFTTVLDGISIGLLVPLLGSLQKITHYDSLPYFLTLITKIFQNYTLEQQLMFSTTAVLSSVLLKNIFLAASMYLGIWLGNKIGADLILRGSTLLLKVGIGYYAQTRTGELVDKVLSHTNHVKSLIEFSVVFLINATTLVVLFFLLILFSWKMTLLTFAMVLLLTAVIALYSKRLSGLGKKNALYHQDLSSILFETISGISVIKSFSKESYQLKRIAVKIHNHSNASVDCSFGNAFVYILTESLAVIVIGLVFFFMISYQGPGNSTFLLQVLPFFYIIIRMVPHIKHANHCRGLFLSHLPYLWLVHDLLREDNKPCVPDGYIPFSGLTYGIQIENLNFSYKADTEMVLKDINLFIPKGKTTAIVGESGAGKSTLINLLLRFYDPVNGGISLDGKPLPLFQLHSLRQKIGVVSQDVFIFNDTIRNNIAFGAIEPVPYEAIMAAAKKASAHDFILDMPQGYDTVLGDKGFILSGGQKQRISIARAILKNPEILILDEATSAMDNRTEKQIHQAFDQLCENRTVIIITHRLSAIKKADNIIVLKQGTIVESGSEKQLIQNRGEYFNLITA